ncbi:MAG: oxidative damage protection protein [Deltaproteobacteria bacterium]|nr:oxidative damage protection protein [Deltaproteobacteria bacterium]
MHNTEKRLVFCQKFQEELPGLSTPPLPGEFGQRIFEHISEKAWKAWIDEQTKVINELKLQVFKPEAQKTLQTYAEKFLFQQAQSIHPNKD